jgi:hypothetical protein
MVPVIRNAYTEAITDINWLIAISLIIDKVGNHRSVQLHGSSEQQGPMR